MDPSKPTRAPNRSKLLIRFGIIAVVALLLVGTLVAFLSSSKNAASEPALVWLDPAQFTRQMHPGRLTRLYYKVLNLAAPLVKHFTSAKRQIMIDARFFASQGTAIEELQVGTPFGTNETGARAWILSASELQKMRNWIESSKKVELVNSPRMTLGEGTWASVCVGQSGPQGTAFIGVSLDMYPKIVSHQFQVRMNALCTEPGEAADAKTNISAACQVLVPNAGGIVITGSDARQPHGTNHWMILSPTAIDGFGKPIHL